MIEIKTYHDEETGDGTMKIEMSGTGMTMLAEACAIVRSLGDAFESKGGRIIRDMFVDTIKDDEFWALKYRKGEDKESAND